MTPEQKEAIEWLEGDAAFLEEFAQKYDKPGLIWLAERIRANARHSLSLAEAIKNATPAASTPARVSRIATIFPVDGLPKSRMVNRDFIVMSESITGHPAGLPSFAGRVEMTNGVEYVIACNDGRRVIVHSEWFERTDKLPDGRYHCLEVKKKRGPRKSNGDKLPSQVNLDEYQ